MRLLRRMKAEAALLIGIADIGGVWPVMEVIRRLTELADTAVSAAVEYLLADAQRRGASSSPTRCTRRKIADTSCWPWARWARTSSTIRATSISSCSTTRRARRCCPGTEPAAFYVRLTRGLVKLLQERTPDGYVFRTDLGCGRTRPRPRSPSRPPSALDYYESVGLNWERAALIKARPCAGDLAAGEALLRDLAPFIWRKYLDFTAVADIHAMKRQIHAYRGHDTIAVEGHNIKLGRGGIREIEFFVQTQQLIAGGRHPELRERETLATLKTLAEGGWIDAEARADLDGAYRFLRVVENRLQMVADEQTHTLPADREGLERFARFAGFADRDTFAEALLAHLRNVQRHYATLFENAPMQRSRPAAVAVSRRMPTIARRSIG